jgi:hypothetical protein
VVHKIQMLTERLGGRIISSICPNCESSGKEKCWSCDGEGGKWNEIEGELEWENVHCAGEMGVIVVLTVAEQVLSN